MHVISKYTLITSFLLFCSGFSSSQVSAHPEEAHPSKLHVVGVKPNELGVKRIQQHQEVKGLHPATLEVASAKEELILSLDGKDDTVTFENDPEALDLPISVDNRFQTAPVFKTSNQPVVITGFGPDEQNLQLAKQILNNGQPLFFLTDLSSWVLSEVKADPEAENNPHAGELAVVYQTGNLGKDAVCILGYNDGIWIDVNGNNAVDSGEKGAFLVEGLVSGRYIWVAYDAFLSSSAVEDALAVSRTPIANGSESFAVVLVPMQTIQPIDQEPAPLEIEDISENVKLNEIVLKAFSSLLEPVEPAHLEPAEPAHLEPTKPVHPAEPTTLPEKPTESKGNHQGTTLPILPSTPIIVAPLSLTINSPLPNSRVHDSTLCSVVVGGGTPIKEVAFFVDGSLTSTLTTPPYQIILTTTSWKKGKHTISVTATNVDGEQVSKSIEVNRKKKH